MIAVESLSTRIAEVMPARTGHMSTSLSLFNDLPTSIAPTILLCHLQANRQLSLTLPFMKELETSFTMSGPADWAT